MRPVTVAFLFLFLVPSLQLRNQSDRQILNRVHGYWQAMEKWNFDKAWSFFGARMRESTGRDSFLSEAKQWQGIVTLRRTGNSTLEFTTTGEGIYERRMVIASTPIHVKMNNRIVEEKELDVPWLTYWVFERPPGVTRFDWYMVKNHPQ